MKQQYNKLYSEVSSVADMYIDTLVEDIIPLQYNKISHILGAIADNLDNLNILEIDIGDENKDEILEKIQEIFDIENNLKKHDPSLVRKCLKEYIIEKKDYYHKKDQEIDYLLKSTDEISKENKLVELINRSKDEKKDELRREITNRYDRRENLEGYSEKNASDKQKSAWANRDIMIQKGLQQELLKWEKSERENYLKAIEVYSSSDRAQQIKLEQIAQQNEALKLAQQQVAQKEQENRIGKQKANVDEYLLVKEGILTKEEAELFNYQELNTYQAYYGENESDVKAAFKFARKLYAGDEVKGLKELASVSHDKITYVLNSLELDHLTFEEIVKHDRIILDFVLSNKEMLGIFNVEELVELNKAQTEDDFESIKKLLDQPRSDVDNRKIFKWSAEKGYNHISLAAINKIDSNVQDGTTDDLLKSAAKGGNKDILSLAFNKFNNIRDITIEQVILESESSNDHFKFMLNLFNARITPDIAQDLFGDFALKQGGYNRIGFFFKKYGNMISSEFIEERLMYAADLNNDLNVTCIFEVAGNKLSKKSIEEAFESAFRRCAYKGALAVVSNGADKLSVEFLEKYLNLVEEQDLPELEEKLAALIYNKMDNATKLSEAIVPFVLPNITQDIDNGHQFTNQQEVSQLALGNNEEQVFGKKVHKSSSVYAKLKDILLNPVLDTLSMVFNYCRYTFNSVFNNVETNNNNIAITKTPSLANLPRKELLERSTDGNKKADGHFVALINPNSSLQEHRAK